MTFIEFQKEFLAQCRKLAVAHNSDSIRCVIYVSLDLWNQEIRAACHEYNVWDPTNDTLFGCEFYIVHTTPHGIKVYDKGE